MTAPDQKPNIPNAAAATGNPAPSPALPTREPPWVSEIGALFLATAKRLATDEKYRLAIQKMLV